MSVARRVGSGLPLREIPQDRRSKSGILHRQRDFQRLRSEGRVARGESVVLVYITSGQPRCRYAVVAGRRVGKATRRNRAKRVLREAQRRLLQRTALEGIDLLLIAKPSTVERTSLELQAQITSMYKREGLDRAGTEFPVD